MNLILKISATVLFGLSAFAPCAAQQSAAELAAQAILHSEGSRRVGKAHVVYYPMRNWTEALVYWILKMELYPGSGRVKESLNMTVGYEVAGDKPSEPESVYLKIDAHSATGEKRYRDNHRISIYVDDMLFLSNDPEVLPLYRFPENNDSYIIKQIPYKDFRRLLTAKKLTIQLGQTKAELEPRAIEALNDLDRTIER
ncbi:MAG TPA: hypothetical protein VF658_19860 [Pyrinomonadaceae bacterium]|jgi:hypothetical protein